MLQAKMIFQASLKVIGVLTLIWGINQIGPVILQFYSVYNQPDMMTANDLTYFRFSLLFQVIYPIILVATGIYLLRGGAAIVDLAFNDSIEENRDQVRLSFFLLMKLAGLALIIYSLPKMFQIISNIMFVTSVYTVETSEHIKFIVQNLAATVINLLLGFYLLKSGKLFYKIGFAKNEDMDNEIIR